MWHMAKYSSSPELDGALDTLYTRRQGLLGNNGQLRRSPETDDYIWAGVDVFRQLIRGIPVKTMRTIANIIAEEDVSNIYPEIRPRLDAVHEAGDLLMIVSAAPRMLIAPLAKRLGAAAATGANYYRQGSVMHRWRPNSELPDKGQVAQRLAQKFDATLFAAYGDSRSDKPMLSIATHPYAVNPTADLRTEAIERAWAIIDCAHP